MIARQRQNYLVTGNRQIKEEFERQLLKSQFEAREEALSAISKELHDNVGQLLGTTKMLLGVSQRSPASSADAIRTAEETLSTAIHELRSLSKTLNKEWLELFDLKQNLATEISRINASGIISVKLTDDAKVLNLTSEEQIILFRIVQEAIQNAVKHAGANVIEIRIQQIEMQLQIAVMDNGQGFSAPARPSGIGLLNMKQRAALLNGQINWANTGNGTTVTISLPIQTTSDD